MTPKQLAQKYAQCFEAMKDSQVSVHIKPSSLAPFKSIFRYAQLAKLGNMENPPAKRSKDGKNYTPPCLHLHFDDGDLYLIIEDMLEPVIGMAGVHVVIGQYTVSFTRNI